MCLWNVGYPVPVFGMQVESFGVESFNKIVFCRVRTTHTRGIHTRAVFTPGIILQRDYVRVGQLALGCESNWVKSTHDAYESPWKCGERKFYFSPSAGGWRKRKVSSVGHSNPYPELLEVLYINTRTRNFWRFSTPLPQIPGARVYHFYCICELWTPVPQYPERLWVP